jgi:hypothetical protein
VDTQATLTSAIANFTQNPTIEKIQPDGSVKDETNLSGIFIAFLLTIGIGSIVGASLAFLIKSESFIYIGFVTGFLYNLLTDYFYIYMKLWKVHPPLSGIIAAFIFIPLMVGFLFTLLEWLRSKD